MKSRTYSMMILSILTLIVSACNSPSPTPQPIDTFTPEPEITQLPSPTPISPSMDEYQTSSPEALAACDLEKQAYALQENQIPDWTSLGIDTCYDLVFDLADDGQSYTGSARITFSNLSSQPLDELVLRIYPNAPVIYGGELTVDSASMDGQPLQQEIMLADGTAVSLALPQQLTPQATLTLDLTFSGKLSVDFTNQSTYGVFMYNSSGSISMLVNSYPMIAVREGGQWRANPVNPSGDAVISNISLYLAEVRVPDGWKVAASGTLLEQSKENGKAVYKMVGGPIREFAWTASPSYEERTELINDIFIRHWALPETETAWAEAMQVTIDSIETFIKYFGPYPYNELDVIALPLNNAGGVEYPGLILIQESYYTSTAVPRLLPTIVSHEVAHQWWFAVVGSDVLLHPWQDEALASFSAQLYYFKHDLPFYQGTREYYENRVLEIEGQFGNQGIGQPVSAFEGMKSAYSAIVYQKGELFFEALLEKIGDDAFYKALQDYYTGNMYRIASPDELLDSFETTCGCDLEGLYNEWGVR